MEAQAATLWQSERKNPAGEGRRLQMGDDDHMNPIGDGHAPSLDEMMVSGTPANALLSRLFIDQEQPQVAFPTDFALDDSDGGNHRRLQAEGDRLRVTIDTHAATPAEADRIVARLVPPEGSLLDSGNSGSASHKSKCDASLAPCVYARKASVGECLLCAKEHSDSDTCTAAMANAFCGGR
jgi:hypothetical protein